MSGTVTEYSNARPPTVLIFGAGSVGSLLGGVLADTGFRVTMLGRHGTGKTIRKHGLQIELPNRRFTAHTRHIDSLEGMTETPDIILLATRAYAVEPAIPDIKAIAGPKTTLVTLQNGIGTEELIARALPDIRHVAASLTLSAESERPGQVASTSRSGGIAIAPVSADSDVDTIYRMFQISGLRTMLMDDYRSMKWSKLLLNMMANAVPAILERPPGEVYRNPVTFQIEHAAIREAIQVIEAERARVVSLPGFPTWTLPWIFRLPEAAARRLLRSRVEGGRGDKMPSLYLDLQSDRGQTEARWLYGAVADAGARTGIRTPVNRRLLRVLDAIAVNPELKKTFRGQPERLARNVMLGEEPIASLSNQPTG